MDGWENVDPETVEWVDEEVAEKERLSGGQEKIAGDGEIDGDGEESLVNGGEFEAILSVADDGLRVFIGNREESSSWSYIVTARHNVCRAISRQVKQHGQ